MSVQSGPEEVVRKFFDCYIDGRPEDFDEIVAPDYLDYGHTPPGRGPSGARDDYENAVRLAGGVIHYTIDMMVVDGDMVAVLWTGTPPNGDEMIGLSLYRTSGGMIRSARRALTGNLVAWPNPLSATATAACHRRGHDDGAKCRYDAAHRHADPGAEVVGERADDRGADGRAADEDQHVKSHHPAAQFGIGG